MSNFRQYPRGIRDRIPSGYVIGRSDSGNGRPHLIHLSELGAALASTGSVASGGTVNNPEEILSVFAPGPFTSNQNFIIPAAIKSATFPCANIADQSFALCKVGAHAPVTFYWLSDLGSFLALGAPHGVLAQFDFAANTSTGVVTWITGAAVTLSQVTTLIMPSSADPSFSTVHLGLYGDVI